MSRKMKPTQFHSTSLISVFAPQSKHQSRSNWQELIYTEFLGYKMAPPKVGDPVRPNTLNMPKSGPEQLPLFISKCISERIKIGPHFPKLSQKDCVSIFMTHGVYSARRPPTPLGPWVRLQTAIVSTHHRPIDYHNGVQHYRFVQQTNNNNTTVLYIFTGKQRIRLMANFAALHRSQNGTKRMENTYDWNNSRKQGVVRILKRRTQNEGTHTTKTQISTVRASLSAILIWHRNSTSSRVLNS